MGLVFAFELNDQVIGTIRMMPMNHGLTLTEQLLERAGMDRASYPHSWDAGRLVVMPEYRVGQDVLRRCLYLTLQHLIENVELQNLLGSCNHVLSRLYRRFGFSVLAPNVLLPGTEKHYTLIHGLVPDVLAALTPADERIPA